MSTSNKFYLLKKETIDCSDYLFKIFGEIFGFIDCEKHVTSLIQHQEKLNGEMGAWSESFNFSKGNEAPLTTAEAIIALLSFSQRSDANNATKRACNYLIQAQNKDDGGWKDLVNYSVNDAAGCVVAALSEVEKKRIMKIPEEALRNAVNFIMSQQNDDGGWDAIKDQKSKMHYTYFALWGLAESKSLLSNKNQIDTSMKKGIHWIMENSKKNNDEGLSLSLGDAPSPVATALAILCFLNIGKKSLIKSGWVDFLKATTRNGGMEEISDTSLVYGVRRTYNFRSIPWIVEALVRNNERLDSEVVQDALRKHKKFELADGGFVSDVGKTDPVVWQTSWSIRMMHFLTQELRNNLKFYIDNSIKKSLEMSRRIGDYEKGLNPEKKIIKVYGTFSVALAAITVYLLYFVTNSSFGRIIWHPFAIGSSLVITASIAYYWQKRRKLNKFNGLLLTLVFSVINILLGLIP